MKSEVGHNIQYAMQAQEPSFGTLAYDQDLFAQLATSQLPTLTAMNTDQPWRGVQNQEVPKTRKRDRKMSEKTALS